MNILFLSALQIICLHTDGFKYCYSTWVMLFIKYFLLKVKLATVKKKYALYAVKWRYGGARGVMVIVLGNRHGDTSSNPGRDCISHSTNTLGKGMNPIILPPAMGK